MEVLIGGAVIGVGVLFAGVVYLADARRIARGESPRFSASTSSTRRARLLGVLLAMAGVVLLAASTGAAVFTYSLIRGMGEASAGQTVTLKNGARFVVPQGWEADWMDPSSQLGRELLEPPPARPGWPQMPTPVQELNLSSLADDGVSSVSVVVYGSDADLVREQSVMDYARSRLRTSRPATWQPAPLRIDAGSDTSASAVLETHTPEPDSDFSPFSMTLTIQKPGHGPMRIQAALPLDTQATGTSSDLSSMVAGVLRFVGMSF